VLRPSDQKSLGWQPLYVQAFTSGGSARFDTIWESPFKGADLDALQSKLLKAMQSVKVAGLSIAIARNGHLLYASGLGMADKEAGVPMNVNHRLRVGSVSNESSGGGCGGEIGRLRVVRP
jgi:CubicO group peptidase (beta-lactamase class C family)